MTWRRAAGVVIRVREFQLLLLSLNATSAAAVSKMKRYSDRDVAQTNSVVE